MPLLVLYLININLINYVLFTAPKYEPIMVDNAYKVQMKLTIKAVTKADYGTYKCVSKNSLGDTDSTIKLYRKYFHD